MSDFKLFGISFNFWLLAMIILAAFFIRVRGIDWPRFHPDEYPIAQWIERGTPDRVYPGGTFMLIRPFRFGWEKTLSLVQRWQTYTGHETQGNPRPDYILMGRYYNAFIGSLACLFVYLTAYILSKSRPGALFCALLMAFAQFPVEHAHYAQSDISMLFVVTVLMWLWTAAIARERIIWFVAAGFVCGFAAGTKFTLVILLFPWLLYSLLRGLRAERGHRLSRSITYTVGGLLLFVIGLVSACPAITDFEVFMAGMAHEKVRVYGETVTNLGIMAGDDRVRILSHLRSLGLYMLTSGVGWLVLWCAGMIILLSQHAYRRFWLPFFGIPVIYTYYWIAVAPWVRTQEFMNFIPFAAVLAGLPLVESWRRWRRLSWRVLVVCAALIAFGGSFQRSMRVSSIYGWLDSRLLATRWLQRHGPPNATYAAEKYANVDPRGVRVGVDMAARVGLEALQAQNYDFLLSQGTVGTRGMFNPLTHELYPHYQEAYEHFLAGTDFLKSWALMPTVSTHTSFSSMPIELYGFRKGTGQYILDRSMSRPAFISHERFETLYPRGHHLGTATSFMIDHHGITFGISSAKELEAPVYVILHTEERPAEVKLKGLGRRLHVQLAPYDHAVVALTRPFWMPRMGHIETIHAKAKQQNKHITYIPCYLQVAFSQAEADAIVADLPSAPRQVISLSSEQQEHLQTILDADVSTVDYMGTSAIAYDQFARFHYAEKQARLQPLRVNLVPAVDMPPESDGLFGGLLELPFRRSSATLNIKLDVAVLSDPLTSIDLASRLRFLDARTGIELAVIPVNGSGQWHRGLELTFPPGCAGSLGVRISAPAQFNLLFENIELAWCFKDVLRAEIARSVTSASDQSKVTSEANGTIPLPALTDDTGNRRLPLDIDFQPFLRLIDISLSDAGQLSAVFRASKGNPPALNAVLYRRKRGRWRALERIPLVERSVLAGEQLVVTFTMDPSFFQEHLDDFGIGVETSVEWFPGRLEIPYFTNDVVPIHEWIKGLATTL